MQHWKTQHSFFFFGDNIIDPAMWLLFSDDVKSHGDFLFDYMIFAGLLVRCPNPWPS
jgi:hypothetical protein